MLVRATPAVAVPRGTTRRVAGSSKVRPLIFVARVAAFTECKWSICQLCDP